MVPTASSAALDCTSMDSESFGRHPMSHLMEQTPKQQDSYPLHKKCHKERRDPVQNKVHCKGGGIGETFVHAPD